jgi:flagellar biosynthesis protein FlhF
MIIKKFRASTAEEAQRKIEEELGPEAMILTTRPIKEKGIKALFGGEQIEITAAIDEDDLRAHERTRPTAPRRNNEAEAHAEKKAFDAQENLADLKKVLKEMAPDGKTKEPSEHRQQAPVSAPVSAPASAPLTYGDPRYGKKRAVATEGKVESSSDGVDTVTLSSVSKGGEDVDAFSLATKNLVEVFGKEKEAEAPYKAPQRTVRGNDETEKKNIRRPIEVLGEEKEETTTPAVVTKRAVAEDKKPDLSLDALRQVIREEMMQAQKSVSVGALDDTNDEDIFGSVRFLISKGVSRSIAVSLEEKLSERFADVDITEASTQRTARINATKNELSTMIKTAGPIYLKSGEPTVAALVGPTGVGKTTTLMKIAAQYSLTLKKRVAIISLDRTKPEAEMQLKCMVQSLGLDVPIFTVRDGYELQHAMMQTSNADLVLIDTSGCSQYDWKYVDTLAEMFTHIDDMQIFLTMSATTKPVDIYGIIQQFSVVDVDSCIFTKLDETMEYGIFVNVCVKTGLPLRYFTTGRSITEDLKLADSVDLARKILVQHNSKEFQNLRRMAAS